MIHCTLCRWFRTPDDKVGRAIFAIHLRTEHPDRWTAPLLVGGPR